jgi:hypothetical protein
VKTVCLLKITALKQDKLTEFTHCPPFTFSIFGSILSFPSLGSITAPFFVGVSGGALRWASLSLLVVALPVVVYVTSGRFTL